MKYLFVAWVASIVVAATRTADASTSRIAVVVGNNIGNQNSEPLHFAEADAAKFAGVLGELGGVAPEHLFVLQSKPLAALIQTFVAVKQLVAQLHKTPADRVVVVFYFSGHSDGEALELGRDRLTFSALRRWLAALGADVRVALVDSCKSGALLAAKGGKPGSGFLIRMTDEVASTGEALLTSSAADEIALESREIAGSFFTHHLISGLRGAADSSGDGRVTLTEAYQYAYSHTIKTTGATVYGMQHPAYNYRLSGEGELVLSELGTRTAMLELPGGFDRIVVFDAVRDQVTAEVTADTHVRIAVQSGRYALRASRDGRLFAGQVAVVEGTPRIVRGDELALTAIGPTTAKGDLADPSGSRIMVAGGGGRAVADHLGVVPGARVELVVPAGLSLAFSAGSRTASGVRETAVGGFVGYRRTATWAAWSAWGGLELGGGAVTQSSRGNTSYAGMFAAGAVVGLGYELTPGLAFAIESIVPAELIKLDGKVSVLVAPSAWLGLSVSL